MELYFKDLISNDSSLEKLVDDLMLVVQGAEEFAQANGASLKQADKEEITSGLERLKVGYHLMRHRAVAGARAVDSLMHRYPYSTAGFAFAFGLLAARLFRRKR